MEARATSEPEPRPARAGRRDAIRALVEEDRVHRDVYLSEEVFALEPRHFFANTWSYLGHASEVPEAGDYVTREIAGLPLVIVRQADGAIGVLYNRCAHILSIPCRRSNSSSEMSAPTLTAFAAPQGGAQSAWERPGAD